MFLPDTYTSLLLFVVRADREEIVNNSRKSDGGLMPIERDDWPGPPEPAAAYPELCKYNFDYRSYRVQVSSAFHLSVEELSFVKTASSCCRYGNRNLSLLSQDYPVCVFNH
jgi:hypothetical protein